MRHDPARSSAGQWIGRGLLILAVLMPVMWVLGYSLLYSLGAIGMLSTGITTRHWSDAFVSGGLWKSLLYTPLIAMTSTCMATCLAMGLVLSHEQVRRNPLVTGLLCLGLGTPAVVMAMMVDQILNPGGYLSRLLFHLGVSSPDQFPVVIHDDWSVGIVLAQTATTFPVLALSYLNVWRTARVDRYLQLSRALGATDTQCRWRVACPILWSRGRPLLVLTFLWNLASFEIPFLLGSQSPQFFSVLTFRHFGMFDLNDRPIAFAFSVTYFLITAWLLKWLILWRPARA